MAVFVGSSNAQTTITLGETNQLRYDDSGNAGLLLAQGPYNLPQAATINTLSFYVTTSAGQLRLGIYTAGPNNNCAGGSLKAQTAAFATKANRWNTAPVTAPVQLPVGNYCLAYEPSSNSLHFVKDISSGVGLVWYNRSFGTFPATFSNSPNTDPNHWSLYATLTPAAPPPPTLSISFNPTNPTINTATAKVGDVVAKVVVTWSNGSPFTGTLSFGSPYFADGGAFSFDGSKDVILAQSLVGEEGTIQNITVFATQ